MYLPLKWLQEFVKFNQKPDKVAEIITLGGFEVEQVFSPGEALKSVIVGQIKTIVSHAEADRLSVCKVNVGQSKNLTIVCGARNIKPGQKVPVALVGTTLPDGMIIEKRKFRGVESQGMICAEDELGLGDDHEGILILPDGARIGQKVSVALGLNDTVLDITVSPNRADAQSVIGIAKEFAALSNQKFHEPVVTVKESKKHVTSKELKVVVQDYNLCPKYTARVVKNITVGPSPQWLQSRLRAAGHNPINNVVDVANYVMLEYGQPLHTFDAKRVQGKKIVVKKAGKKKKFTTLDGVERELTSDMLMIADGKEDIAIAGIMGGQNSEITSKTIDIVIESAIFKPLSIRKTRQKLGLATDASVRFERGIWWDLPEQAVDRAAQLIQKVAGGEVATGRIVSTKKLDLHPVRLTVSAKQISGMIGRKFTYSDIKKYLSKLSFDVEQIDRDTMRITVPVWRQDVRVPSDIVEEVGRMYGWNKLIPSPITGAVKPVPVTESHRLVRIVQDALVSSNMTAALNYSFYGQDLLEQFGWTVDEHFRIENPMNKEQEYLRVSLVPDLYTNVLTQYQEHSKIRLFEVGTVFYKKKKGLPDEHHMVAGVLYEKSKRRGEDRLVRQLQGIIDTLFSKLNIDQGEYEFVFDPENARAVNIKIGKEIVGWYGWLVQHEEKLGVPPVWFEFDLGLLAKHYLPVKVFSPLSDYPAVVRDMTFRVSPEVSFFAIQKTVRTVDPLIIRVEAGDLFKETETSRGATIRITYQSHERTLAAEEVTSIEKKIITTMSQKFNAHLKK